MAITFLDQLSPERAVCLHSIPAIHRVDHVPRIGEDLYTAGTAKLLKSIHAGEYLGLLVRHRAEIFRKELQFHSVAIYYYRSAAGRLIRRTVTKARSVRVYRHDRCVGFARVSAAVLFHELQCGHRLTSRKTIKSGTEIVDAREIDFKN